MCALLSEISFLSEMIKLIYKNVSESIILGDSMQA